MPRLHVRTTGSDRWWVKHHPKSKHAGYARERLAAAEPVTRN